LAASFAAAPAERTGIEVVELRKDYGRKKALAGISFKAEKNGFSVLLGPSGAGKTTTLRLLAGLEPQSGGEIYLDGREVSDLPPRSRELAMIFDNLALYPNRNGFENMASSLSMRGVPREEIRRRVFAMADKLNLTLTLERLPKTMSGGERQRLALGRALIKNPKFYLLDEPLSSLDAPLRFKLRTELKRLQREEGRTFLLATPDFHEALAVADEIVVLHEGRVAQKAAPQDLYDRPADVRTALLVGSPRINLWPARLGDDGRLRFAGFAPPLPPRLQKRLAGWSPRRPLSVGLRPENLRLGPVGRRSPGGPEGAGGAEGWGGPEGSSGLTGGLADQGGSEGRLGLDGPAEDQLGGLTAEGPLVDVESLGRAAAATVETEGQKAAALASASVLAGGLAGGLGERVSLTIVNLGKLMVFDDQGRNLE
jgi:multiple sugar transport system ATP-binding protein